MWSAATWVWRHRRAITGGTIVAGCAYGAYWLWRESESLEGVLLRAVLRGNEGEARERGMREHFERTQRECDAVVVRQLARLRAQLARLLDFKTLRQSMKEEGSEMSEVRWKQLQSISIARVLAAVYALALLQLRVRVRLHIVARQCLLRSKGMAPAEDEDERLAMLRFLSVEQLTTDGLQEFVGAVCKSVASQLEQVPLDRELSIAELAEMLDSMRTAVEHTDGASDCLPPVRRVLVAEAEAEVAYGAAHSASDLLLREVLAIGRSEPMRILLGDLLEDAFSRLFRMLPALYEQSPPLATDATPRVPRAPPHKALPMAKLVPKLLSLMPVVLADEPSTNELQCSMSADERLANFCWSIFSASSG